uniref:Uncharacterized protein n=1 Tax=Oryza meridionalis TaxID=40149 RepID=A0A0E0DDM3_9ORYZ
PPRSPRLLAPRVAYKRPRPRPPRASRLPLRFRHRARDSVTPRGLALAAQLVSSNVQAWSARGQGEGR